MPEGMVDKQELQRQVGKEQALQRSCKDCQVREERVPELVDILPDRWLSKVEVPGSTR